MVVAGIGLGENTQSLRTNEMTTPRESEARRRSPRRSATPATVKRIEKAAADIVPCDDALVGADVETMFGGIVARYAKAGVVGARYAERRAGNLDRRGVSTQHIREKLKLAGSERDSIEHAPGAARDELAVDSAGINLQAARRRRPGPFRTAAECRERRTKDLSVLGRVDFVFDIGRRVIDADELDELTARETAS